MELQPQPQSFQSIVRVDFLWDGLVGACIVCCWEERWGPGTWGRYTDQAWMGHQSLLPSLHRHMSMRLAECAWLHLPSISDPPTHLHLHRTLSTCLEDKSPLTGLHSGPPSLSHKIARMLFFKKMSIRSLVFVFLPRAFPGSSIVLKK